MFLGLDTTQHDAGHTTSTRTCLAGNAYTFSPAAALLLFVLVLQGACRPVCFLVQPRGVSTGRAALSGRDDPRGLFLLDLATDLLLEPTHLLLQLTYEIHDSLAEATEEREDESSVSVASSLVPAMSSMLS